MLNWLALRVRHKAKTFDLERGALLANGIFKMNAEQREELLHNVSVISVSMQRDAGIDLKRPRAALLGNPLLNQMLRQTADEYQKRGDIHLWAATSVWYFTIRAFQEPEIAVISRSIWDNIASSGDARRPQEI